jgi:thiol-disulfide isomerase/thioredoxin
MSGWNKHLRRALVFVVIVVAVLLTVKVIRRTFFPKSTVVARPYPLRPGLRMPLQDVNWAESERTLVVALNKDCQFCTMSAPFYQKLVEETSNHEGVRMLAILPHEVDEGKEYLKSIGVDIAEVRRVEPESLGLQGTPALVLVNKQGIIRGLWVGKVPQDKEAVVLKHYLDTER